MLTAGTSFLNGRMSVSYLRYVKHADVPTFEAAGWVWVADLGPTHGQWACLMLWTGAGEP